jgi:hypothetical protein
MGFGSGIRKKTYSGLLKPDILKSKPFRMEDACVRVAGDGETAE